MPATSSRLAPPIETPTDCVPGSREKIDLMCERAKLRLPLHIHGDRNGVITQSPVPVGPDSLAQSEWEAA